MAYTKQTWQDLPSKTTPINASRLGHIEQGIYDAASTADTAASDASSAISGLADKVDKVEGKGLSTNDFTDALKTKLDNIETGAEVNVQSDWNQSDNSADDYIKNKPSLGTAAYKNSTSVVTDSSDLVESGAVKDIVGWGNKNLLPNNAVSTSKSGVVFTVNNDKSITLFGSATANWAYEIYAGSIDIPVPSIFSIGAIRNASSVVYVEIDGTNYYIPADKEYVEIPAGTLTKCRIDGNQYFAPSTPITYSLMICTAEEYAKSSEYEPYHASVADTLRDAEVVEGMNLLDKSNRLTYNATATDTSTGINISCTNKSSANAYMNFNNLGSNKQYKVSSNVDYTSGNGAIFVMGSNDGITYSTTIGSIENITADGKKVLSFNTGTYPYIRISCFATRATAQDGNISFNELMLYDAIYNDPTYKPYYIPLKDVVPNKCDNSVIAPIENGATASKSYAVGEHFIRDGAFCTCKQAISQGSSFTLNTNYTAGDVDDELISEKGTVTSNHADVTINSTYNYVIKGHKTCNMAVRFTLANALSSDTIIINMPFNGLSENQFVPILNDSYQLISYGYVDTYGKFHSFALAAGNYRVYGAYICQ